MSQTAEVHAMGTRIRAWRKGKNLKGYELAKVINISQGSLSDIENNKSLPSALTLNNLSEYTNIDVMWVITGKGVLAKEKASTDCTTCKNVKDILDKISFALEQ